MTLEEIAEKLRPLALELSETPDEGMQADAIIAKVMIFVIMGLAEQMDSEQRKLMVSDIAVRLGPIFFANFPES